MSEFRKAIRYHWPLYLFLLPMLVFLLLFEYLPLYGAQIAFKDFSAYLGIWRSPWVGLKHFYSFFESYYFEQILWNTLALSFYAVAAEFFVPIVLALLLHYAPAHLMRRIGQTATYMPHFISTVVVVGIVLMFLAPDTGVLNRIIDLLGGESVQFLGKPRYFRSIYVWSGVWQDMGWDSIIYLAALSSISVELHEAAIVDGAKKLRRIISIDLPGISTTIIVLLILRVGRVMSVVGLESFDKVYLMQNGVNLEVSEVIGTYVYKRGLLAASYDFAAAIGLFNNVINLVLLLVVNRIARRISETSLW